MARIGLVHKKARGRPRKGPREGKRAILSVRITLELKQYLDREAAASDRSLSKEVELRLKATMGRRLVVQMPVVELISEIEHEQEKNRPY